MMFNMTSKTPFADAIKNEVFRKRRNYAILITGKTQMRKSTTGVKLCFELDPNFSFEKDFAIIKTKDYLNILNEKEKRGTVKFLDELGVGLNHRQWFSFFNKAMSYTMQTHGHEGKIIIATVPYEDYIDNDVKKLFDTHIEVLQKNEKEKYCTAKVMELQWNQKLKKMYHKLPRGRYPDGSVKIIRAVKIAFPKDEIMDKYFSISNESKEILKHDLVGQVGQMERDKIKRDFNPEVFVEEILKEPEKFVRDYYGRKSVSKASVMNNFPVGETRAQQIKELAEQKLGFNKNAAL